MEIKSIFPSILFLAFLVGISAKNAKIDEEFSTISSLDALIEETRECNSIPALGFAGISKNAQAQTGLGKNLHHFKSYGKQSIKDNMTATDKTQFCIGSVTKHMTATLVLKMLRTARLQGLNVSVSTLVKSLNPSVDFRGSNLRDVTIEDLLSHRSGITNVNGFLQVGYPLDFTREDMHMATARLPRTHANREAFIYNNYGYTTAGYLMELLSEKLTGQRKTWEALMRANLFIPMGMNDEIDFADTAEVYTNTSRLVRPNYFINGEAVETEFDGVRVVHPFGPAGSLCMSPRAMLAWSELLINKGKFGDQQIVEEADIEDSWTPRVKDSPLGEYSLGWINGNYQGHRFVKHTGGLPPFLSALTVFPDAKISFFTSISIFSYFNQQLFHLTLFDKLMGIQNSSWPNNCNTGFVTFRPVFNESKLDIVLKEYIGVYAHDFHGNISITSNERDELRFTFGRFGTAKISCVISKTKCELIFDGVIGYTSQAFGLANVPYYIHFWKNEGEHAYSLSLPWFFDVLTEFQLANDVEPEKPITGGSSSSSFSGLVGLLTLSLIHFLII